MLARFALISAFFFASIYAVASEEVIDFSQRFDPSLSIQETLEIAAENPSLDTTVRILLRGGGSLEGNIQAYLPKKGSVLVVHQDSTNSIAALNDIVSVTVINPGAAKYAFQGNRIFIEPYDTVVSPLAFRRQLNELSTSNSIAIITEFSELQIKDETCRFYSAKVLEALNNAVLVTMTDELGNKALSKIGNQIEVKVASGSQLSLVVENSKALLQFDCMAPLDANFAETISNRLDEVL